MTPNIGKLLPADELLHHQIVDSFGTISESDLSWTEKIWFSIPRKDGGLQIDMGLGRYHNRDVMDGFGGVSRGRNQWTVRGSRELSLDPSTTAVGPIVYEVVEPLRRVRAKLAENDVQPISFEVEFTGVHPAFFEDRHRQRDEHGFRVVSDVVRYHQAGSVAGWISVEGKREEIRPNDWYGFRDHSWGVRLDVGTPAPDLRPARDFGEKGLADMSFLLNWTPMLMERKGEKYEYHFYLQMRDGKPFYFSGYRNLANGQQERIARVRSELRYDDKTRRMRGGKIHVDMLSGENTTLEVEVLGESGFHLGPALYLGFEGKKHGQWRGPLQLEGEKIEDTLDVTTLHRIHQLRDCIIRIKEGDATGYGIFESVVIGAWEPFGLTRENSLI